MRKQYSATYKAEVVQELLKEEEPPAKRSVDVVMEPD